jgi:hypothetical protein
VGFQVTGRYAGARDRYTDPVEAANREAALAAGADPDTLRIGRREERNERAAGEAEVEWRPEPDALVAVSGGLNQAVHDLEQTSIGAVQAEDWRSSSVQVRGKRGRLFAQAFLNASHAVTPTSSDRGCRSSMIRDSGPRKCSTERRSEAASA